MNNLRLILHQLPEPTEFFHGRIRSSLPVPDNVIVFHRTRSADLFPYDGSDDLHHRWVLLVALEGFGRVRVDRKELTVVGPGAMLIAPLHLHGYTEVDPDIDWLFVTFDWPQQTFDVIPSEYIHIIPDFLPLLQRFLQESISQTSEPNIQCTMLLCMLEKLFPHHFPQSQKERGGLLLPQVQQLLMKGNPGTIGVLAKKLGISESHLRARFRTETGTSLGKYLRSSRIHKAALMLRQEPIAIGDVALKCGFPDIFTFSRTFKSMFGISPSAFRKGI